MKRLMIGLFLFVGLVCFAQKEPTTIKVDSIQIWSLYPDIKKIETVIDPEYLYRRLDKLGEIRQEKEFIVKYFAGPYSQVKILRKQIKKKPQQGI